MSLAWFSNLLELHASSHNISAGAMCVRAVIVFFVALVLLRLSGTRTFSNGTAFDIVVRIVLGSILGRAVVAASPFFGTILASGVFVVLHRLLAVAAYHSSFVGKLIKGEATVLARQGQLVSGALRRTEVSDNDLHEGLRDTANLDSLAQTEIVRLERNGKISVVKKDAGS